MQNKILIPIIKQDFIHAWSYMEKIQNILYDTDYRAYIAQGGYIAYQILGTQTSPDQKNTKTKKIGILAYINDIFNRMLYTLFPTIKDNTPKTDTIKQENTILKNKSLQEQIRYIINLPDEEYSDNKLTSEIRQYILEVEKHYASIVADYKSHIAPSYREVQSGQYNISGIMGRTYYTHSYPSYIDALRTRDIFSFHAKWDMTFFIYPEDDSAMQSMLKQKATQLRAEIKEATQKGITIDVELEQQYRDVELIREKLATHEERYFEVSYYANLYETDIKTLNETCKKFEQKVAGYGIRMKQAIQRMDEGFTSSLPICLDQLGIVRSAITSSLAGSFPFIANDIVHESGILYGINTQTGGLIIFDRFSSKLENMNSVVLATSGAGKSFLVKLEVMRYLLNGIDVIIIDPENEYKPLCEKLGGTYINIATNTQQHINPFDIPAAIEDVEYGPGDLLRSQIMDLIGMVGLLIGQLSAEEEAILDKALQNTYILRGFSFDQISYENKQSPLMEDLMNVLEGMEAGEKLALKLSKYVSGTFGKLFNNKTNIDINNRLTVFSIRDLEEALKTPAMYSVLHFIRNKIRAHKKKRLLVIDEAWILLQNDISGNFLYGLIKRARKYGLGITTVSQDIEDFVRSKYGKPIIANSALQILLKQSTTSIRSLSTLLALSEAEKQILVASGIGEGLIFAGTQHVGVKILASPYEKDFITTDVK